MQYHCDGYRPGDPDIAPAAKAGAVDVLIVGCGPAGLTLAAQLSQYPAILTLIVERKDGPLQLGQADGVACRTVEMFQAFGFAEQVLREAYWVNETVFWRPDPADPGRIARSGRVRDVEEGLSECPHVILNQARVHAFLLDVMRKSPRRLIPDYGTAFEGLTVARGQDHPVTVRLQGPDGPQTLRARYVVGCDGARSAVRRAIGRRLEGESANQAWGVMDVLAVTDFPDVRLKAVIRSAGQGNILIIPREGGYLIRLYVEMDKLAEDERVSGRNITAQDLIAAAQRILHPYSLDVREVVWWSVYEIGQRLCDRFDDTAPGGTDPRVFIAGDACHTHSPKAGQGMNVSMGDGFNLGWKLGAVLTGQAPPGLLSTYSAERQAVAAELIDFDRHWAERFGAAPDPQTETGTDFQDYFTQHGRFTAGVAFRYAPSMIVGQGTHQCLASGFVEGMRFHSAPVIRLADAKPMHLGHVVRADGRWRQFLFADDGDPGDPSGALHRQGAALADLIARHTPKGGAPDAVIDLRAVLQQGHRDVDLNALPKALLPRKGRLGLLDYEKTFCADPAADLFDLRGIDRAGCLVLVRPDQHVALVLPLWDVAGLGRFLDGALCAMGAASVTVPSSVPAAGP